MRFRLAPEGCGRFGAHMPTQGGIHHAYTAGQEYGCEVIQLFTSSPQQWRARELTEAIGAQFRAAYDSCGIPCVAAHANYLINPGAAKEEVLLKSRQALREELERCAALGIPAVVVHPGSAAGSDEETAMERVIESLRAVLAELPPEGPYLLLETTAGQGASLGCTFEQLARILEGVGEEERVGVCLDTCHIFAAGHDLTGPSGMHQTLDLLVDTVGEGRLKLIHANDSKDVVGAHKDRHENIGVGHIGEDPFRALMTHPATEGVPLIIETPGGKEGHAADVERLKKLRDC